MKMLVDVRVYEFFDVFNDNIGWFSDMCLNELRTKIQQELDRREFGKDISE